MKVGKIKDRVCQQAKGMHSLTPFSSFVSLRRLPTGRYSLSHSLSAFDVLLSTLEECHHSVVYVTSGLVFLPTRLQASGGLQELGCEGGKADGLSSCLFPYLGHQVIICRHGIEESAKGKHS